MRSSRVPAPRRLSRAGSRGSGEAVTRFCLTAARARRRYGDDAATSFAAISEAVSRCDGGIAIVHSVGPTRPGMARLVAEKLEMPQPVILVVQQKDRVHNHGRAFAECVVDDTAYGEVTFPLYDLAITYDTIADAVEKIAAFIKREGRFAAPPARPTGPSPARAPREHHH